MSFDESSINKRSSYGCSFEEEAEMVDDLTQYSGVNTTILEIPALLDDIQTGKMCRDQLWRYFASLTLELVTDQIIYDCINMGQNPSYCVFVVVNDIAKEILLEFIVRRAGLVSFYKNWNSGYGR